MTRYSDKLEEIPMSVFIRIYNGDTKGISFKKGIKKNDACKKLVSDYVSIVGNRNMKAKIYNGSVLINHLIKLRIANICLLLIGSGMAGIAGEISCHIGIKYADGDINGLVKQLKSAIASESLAIDMASKRGHHANNDMDTSYDFLKERVILMKHYKMHMDMNAFSAGEYAYLVKSFCDEVECLERKNNLMKLKRK